MKKQKSKFKYQISNSILFLQMEKIKNMLTKAQHLYFLGISGIGMSALARLFFSLGKKISGSTNSDNEIVFDLEKQGMKIYHSHHESNLIETPDCLIYTEAVTMEHQEILAAVKQGIPVLSYGEALSFFINEDFSLAISGTHGKSSTTGLVTQIMNSYYQTGFLCGAVLKKYNINGGWLQYLNEIDDNPERSEKIRDSVFVAEACEYKETFQNFFPTSILITSLEEDHLDYYKNNKNYFNSFVSFLSHVYKNRYFNKLPFHITLGINSPMEIKLFNKIRKSRLKDICAFYTSDRTLYLKYSHKMKEIPFAYYEYKGRVEYNGLIYFKTRVYFNVKAKKIMNTLDEFDLLFPFPSKEFASNITGALLVLRGFGLPYELIQEGMKKYLGISRRFDFLGKDSNKNKIYTDYAHHPSEIRTLISMMKEYYPDKNLICIFQPHQYSRTLNYFNSFAQAFSRCDETIVLPIYRQRDSEEDIKKVNHVMLANAINANHVTSLAINTENELFQYIQSSFSDSIVVFTGAGNIIDMAEKYNRIYNSDKK